MIPRPDGLLDDPEDECRGHIYSDISIPMEAVCDARKLDPFFRNIDATLRREREIRAIALRTIQILLDDPWKVGGPGAQMVEWASAIRVLGESYARTGADMKRLGEGV